MSKLILLICSAVLLFATQAAAEFALKGEPKIAFVYASAAKDGGWNEAFENARIIMEKKLGTKITVVESIPEETTKIRGAVDLLVRRGHNVIIGTSFGHSDGYLEAAKRYPDVAFLNGAGTTNNSNLESFYARTYEGWYLAGLLAGSMSESNRLGMLGGFPIGLVNWDINAFTLGAAAANPANKTIVIYSNSWWDPAREGQIAKAMLDANADVIATDLSAASVLSIAEKKGAKSVGFQLDMSKHAPKGHVVSVTFRWERYILPTLEAIIAGSWKPSKWGAFVGMNTGVVELAGLNANLSPEILAKVKAVQAKMAAGKFSPFTGPLNKQDGSQLLADGAVLEDGALWDMKYFVEGIIGTMPASSE